MPAAHLKPIAHSVVQVFAQVLPSAHVYGEQLSTVPTTQAPSPSQVLCVCLPLVQVEPHALVDGASLQADALVPSQLPPHSAGLPGHAMRLPRGAPMTGAHLPAVPLSLHASH